MILNALVLVGLREKKTAEELAKHPPVPITRRYRIVVGVGTLAMLGSLFLPWVSDSDASLSLVGVYWALLTRSGLSGFAISQAAVVFALLGVVGAPICIICGALGLVRRRFALVGGVLAVVAGAGLAAALASQSKSGAYGFAAGGVLLLLGFFGIKRA